MKQIRKINGNKFVFDMKSTHSFVSYCATSKIFFVIRKNELLSEAKTTKIDYYMSNNVYKNKRLVMVII